jgi:hypothetical protein
MPKIQIPLTPFQPYMPWIKAEIAEALAPFESAEGEAIAFTARISVDGQKSSIDNDIRFVHRRRSTNELKISQLRYADQQIRQKCGSAAFGLLGDPQVLRAVRHCLPTKSGRYMHSTFDAFYFADGVVLRLSGYSAEQIFEEIESEHWLDLETDPAPEELVSEAVRDAFMVLAEPDLSNHDRCALIVKATELAAPLLTFGANRSTVRVLAPYEVVIVP